ncbi:glycosyltransferase family 2 protein [Psychroserpens algicola]|uniref:Glycosyltransferase n=1 Tax=Psychroserpens algicola TaxID=1719034 RepID=A0ABT0H869_9FLAO|nr:glycosyltransferase family 2 protein [Psychroserpens algicola]MCK8480558.1 glycosyltransferase [Psychroserpens algicola]
MKVSIITATYNSEKTLGYCMDSVLNQTYSDIEYIVIDGNSSDNTVDLITSKAKNAPHIVWVSERDKGIYDALNKGIQKATGDIVGFVHSDDYLADTHCVSDIVAAFKSHQVDGVYGNLHYVSFENPEHIVRNWVSQPFYPKLLKRGWMPAHPTLFLKNAVYQAEGNFNLEYKIAADYDFILRIFNNSKYTYHYLPKTIVKMRVGGASNKSLKNLIRKTKEDLKAAKTNGLTFPLAVILKKNLSKIPQWFSK